MSIREQGGLTAPRSVTDRAALLAAIAELEAQLADGAIELPAYRMKKRFLLRQL